MLTQLHLNTTIAQYGSEIDNIQCQALNSIGMQFDANGVLAAGADISINISDNSRTIFRGNLLQLLAITNFYGGFPGSSNEIQLELNLGCLETDGDVRIEVYTAFATSIVYDLFAIVDEPAMFGITYESHEDYHFSVREMIGMFVFATAMDEHAGSIQIGGVGNYPANTLNIMYNSRGRVETLVNTAGVLMLPDPFFANVDAFDAGGNAFSFVAQRWHPVYGSTIRNLGDNSEVVINSNRVISAYRQLGRGRPRRTG